MHSLAAMKLLRILAIAAAALAAPAAAQEGEGGTYLLSVSYPLAAGERTDGFALASWGVDYLAVCRIPLGWRITAGRNATAEGRLEGEATHGVTQRSDTSYFESLALVRLWGPRQDEDGPTPDGAGTIPATFAGTIRIAESRDVTLEPRHLTLTPAAACPSPQPPEEGSPKP